MPSSLHKHISDMVAEIIRTDPKSILDIGAGFGKWGVLAREFLELHKDRCYKYQWQVRIDAVEIWEEYTLQYPFDFYYDNVYVKDVCDVIDDLPGYDLIIAGDIIEHIEKDLAVDLLKKLINKAQKKFLLSIPLGNWLNNVVVAGNPFEEHRSVWSTKELLALSDKPINSYGYKGVRGDLGVFVYEK